MKIRDSLLKTLSGSEETYNRLFNSNNKDRVWMKLKKPFPIHHILYYSIIGCTYLYIIYKTVRYKVEYETQVQLEMLTMKYNYERLLLNHKFGSMDEFKQYIGNHKRQYSGEWNAAKSSLFKTTRSDLISKSNDLINIKTQLQNLQKK
ncbi:hypothetical protein ABK040_002357 [Willaertia magna]